jgi:hypothetical protein
MASIFDLTTAATLASALGVASDTAALPRLITASSRAIAKYCHTDLHYQAALVESVVPSHPYIFLRAGIVTAITSITVDGVALSPTTYRIDNSLKGRLTVDQQLTSGVAGFSVGSISPTVLPYNTGSIVVTFSAGYITPGQNAVSPGTYPTVNLPEDIEQAAVETAVAMYRRLGRDGDIASTSLGVGSFTYTDKRAIPVSARDLLTRYRKAWH